MDQNTIKINNFDVSNKLPFFLIAGPCAIESKDHAIDHAGKSRRFVKDIILILFINPLLIKQIDQAHYQAVVLALTKA